MYAINTHPEIRYAIGQMAKGVENPSYKHWELGMRILRYLKGQMDSGLIFTKDGRTSILGTWMAEHGIDNDCQGLTVFTDADWRGDATYRSTRGYLVYLNGNLISAKSKLNNTISINVSEAEMQASIFGLQEALWLKNMAKEFGWNGKLINQIQMYTDNNQVVAWVHEPNADTSRSKHFRNSEVLVI
jgi:hypothetical protein